MRVLFVHNDYRKPSGEEAAIRNLASLLSFHGHEIGWLTRSSSEIAGSLRGQAKAFFTGVYNPAARRSMRALLEEFQPDVVQVQNLYPLLSPAVLLPCKEAGIPVVMRCPNYRLFCPNGLHLSHGQLCERCLQPGREWWCLLKNCERNVVKSAGYALRNAVARSAGTITGNVDVFVVLTQFQRQRFLDQGIESSRLAIVPNPLPDRLLDAIPGEGETVSFVGRISHEKGFDSFLGAARRLPDVPFTVAGEVRQAERSLVESAPSNVRLFGHLTEDELDDFLRRTRIVVSPSRCFEGFPTTVTRAMAAGKPVVASRLGALPEIVEEEVTGLLYDPGDIEDLTAKLLRLYTQPRLCSRMGAAGRNRAASAYSRERVYACLLSAFKLALARGS
jgi:glycosyltransferase involved in cell wall biosynthesis